MGPIRTLLDRQPLLSAPVLPEDLHKLTAGISNSLRQLGHMWSPILQ